MALANITKQKQLKDFNTNFIQCMSIIMQILCIELKNVWRERFHFPDLSRNLHWNISVMHFIILKSVSIDMHITNDIYVQVSGQEPAIIDCLCTVE